jgi:hypothetical protein
MASQSNAQFAETDNESTPSFSKKPVDTIRVGNVEIPIWRNEGTKGEFLVGGIPSIRYKDGEEWKGGSSFNRHDLLDLAEAARETAMKIRDLQKNRGQSR